MVTARDLQRQTVTYNAHREVASKDPELAIGKHTTKKMAAFLEVKGWAENLVDKLWDVERKLMDLCSDGTSARLLMKCSLWLKYTDEF
jgi:hypothetical protein